MLWAVPPLSCPTVTTMESNGETFRLAIVCSATTMWLATTIGSIPKCGIAAWPPFPRTVISNPSAEANRAPFFVASFPTFTIGFPCKPKILSTGLPKTEPSNTPSSHTS